MLHKASLFPLTSANGVGDARRGGSKARRARPEEQGQKHTRDRSHKLTARVGLPRCRLSDAPGGHGLSSLTDCALHVGLVMCAGPPLLPSSAGWFLGALRLAKTWPLLRRAAGRGPLQRWTRAVGSAPCRPALSGHDSSVSCARLPFKNRVPSMAPLREAARGALSCLLCRLLCLPFA